MGALRPSVIIPCRREKYASVAFFMISGLQVMSVNISKSLARVVLRSLHVKQRALKLPVIVGAEKVTY